MNKCLEKFLLVAIISLAAPRNLSAQIPPTLDFDDLAPSTLIELQGICGDGTMAGSMCLHYLRSDHHANSAYEPINTDIYNRPINPNMESYGFDLLSSKAISDIASICSDTEIYLCEQIDRQVTYRDSLRASLETERNRNTNETILIQLDNGYLCRDNWCLDNGVNFIELTMPQAERLNILD